MSAFTLKQHDKVAFHCIKMFYIAAQQLTLSSSIDLLLASLYQSIVKFQ